ncbi:T9SS type A sorting domain-containing protein [candidate division KSB1 bacterium]|nr:T9SS type A sorting domain-containing protein [candidate division KSB1 bacterium]
MKQVSILIPLACLLFAVALTAQIPGELPITNPGFEAGDASGWNMWPGDDPKVSIVTDMVSEGVNAAKISGGSGAVYKMVSGEVDIVVGTFYCIVADVLIPSADPLQEGQSVYLAGKAEGSATEWFESPKVITSADDADTWYRLSVGLTYPADAIGLNAEFKWTGTGSDDPGCVYVDNVKVIRMEPMPDIINLGFEEPEDSLFTGDIGWWTWSYGPVSPPAGEEAWFEEGISHDDGERALAISATDWYSFYDFYWWGGYYSWTGQTPYPEGYINGGDNFYMSGWVMTPATDPLDGVVDVALELTFKGPGGNLSNMGYEEGRVWSENTLTENSTSDEWHFLEAFITCPELAPEDTCDRIDFNFVLRQYGEAWGIAFADDVFIARGVSAPNDVKDEPGRIPTGLSLSQNYPNPFNPATNISYSIDRTQYVNVTVYDILGKEIAVLQDGVQNMGQHNVTFDASDLSSGIYIYRLKTENQTVNKRMVLMQ